MGGFGIKIIPFGKKGGGTLRDEEVLLLQDNANVLSAMVKGASGNPVVDRMAITFSLASAYLRTRVWFEYVESDSNWSDGASRKLYEDEWTQQHGFKLSQFVIPDWVVTASTPELLNFTKESLRASLEV